jgi:hypothetical protein
MENGNFIYVYTNEELKTIQAALKKRVTKTIRLNYLNADDAKEFITPLLSKGDNGAAGGEIKVNSKSKEFTIPDKAPVGKNDYALSDTIVVFDYEENIKAIEELVRQIDTRPQQVLVEATILQTSLNEANAFGVDFSIIGDLNFTDFINTGGALSAANSLIKGGTGASGQGFSPSDNRGYAGGTSVGNTSGPGGFKLGVVSGDVAIFLRMLDQVTDTVILSNPKILALNRQPARVLVGKRVGYLNTTQTETSTTQSVEFLDTGTQLYFRPFVSAEGEVRMELKPQVSSAEIRTVTDTGGRAVTIPDEITQELVTNVNVRDGQTIVLGGLFTENSTFTRRQVPVIGDIPILGAAFRGHEDSTVRSEIIFLITPTIVTDTLVAGAAEKASADLERVRAGTRQGLLPWSREKMTDTLNVEAERLARDGKSDEALYKLNRSLSLNPYQPEAYRLREKITGEREAWQDQSMLNNYLDREVAKRSDSVPPAAGPTPHLVPKGSVDVPRIKAPSTDGRVGSAEPTGPVSQAAPAAPAPIITIPGQGSGDERFAGATFSTPEHARSAQAAAATPSTTGAPAENRFTTDAPGNMMVTVNGQTYTVTASGNPPATAGATSTTTAAATPTTDTSTAATSSNSTMAAVASMTTENAASANTPSATTSMATTEPSSTPAAPTDAAIPSILPSPTAAAATSTNAATNSGAQVNTVVPAAANATPAYVVPTLSPDEKKNVAAVRTAIPTLRNNVDLFKVANEGSFPTLGGAEDQGWGDLVAAGLVKDLPANPYVGGPNASKVVIGDAADTAFHTNYGWVYNPKTGQLWAAGFDSMDRPLSKTPTVSAPQPAVASTPATASAQPAAPAEPAAQPAPAGATAGVESDHK